MYRVILKDFDNEIDILEKENYDILQKAEYGIKKFKKYLEKLYAQLVKNEFKSEIEEITFFKTIKPRVFSKLIYYVKLFNIESKRPRGSKKSQVKYLNQHIRRLQVYFNDNLEFYNYYRRGATLLDKHYFVRVNRIFDYILTPFIFLRMINSQQVMIIA